MGRTNSACQSDGRGNWVTSWVPLTYCIIPSCSDRTGVYSLPVSRRIQASIWKYQNPLKAGVKHGPCSHGRYAWGSAGLDSGRSGAIGHASSFLLGWSDALAGSSDRRDHQRALPAGVEEYPPGPHSVYQRSHWNTIWTGHRVFSSSS